MVEKKARVTERSKEKPKQKRITFDTRLKTVLSLKTSRQARCVYRLIVGKARNPQLTITVDKQRERVELN